MGIVIVLKNMSVILLMALTGYLLFKKGVLDEETDKKLSILVVDICNPALSIACVAEDRLQASHREIFQAIVISTLIYCLLILLGVLIPRLLRVHKDEEKFYHMMTVYTNVGFIGLPLARAMLSADAMLYVIIFNVLYSFFFYTHGCFVMKGSGDKYQKKCRQKFRLNLGLISGIISVLIVWFEIPIPEILGNVCIYTGDANTFLAMILLGASVAAIPSARELISNKKLYLFLALRMVIVPMAAAGILTFAGVASSMVLGFTLMLSMPMASMPLMLAEKNGEDTGLLSQGITISTAISFVTITFVLGMI